MKTQKVPKNIYSSPPAIGLYIHIPICLQICPYCDFTKYLKTDISSALLKKYQEALLQEVLGAFQSKLDSGTTVDTLYFGGGTPSLYPTSYLKELVSVVQKQNGPRPLLEQTIEVDPKTIPQKKLHELKEMGFDRISVGVQSFQNDLLALLGRKHQRKDILLLFESLQKLEFQNVSVDLMYGVPNQTLSQWSEDLSSVKKMGVSHVSLYNLNLKRGTPYFRNRKKMDFPSEKNQIQFYNQAFKEFKAEKIMPYEISNFSKKGYESKHNLACWRGQNYIGVGVGASSFLENKRWSNVKSIPKYIEKMGTLGHAKSEVNTLTLLDQKKEKVMLRLRMVEGLKKSEYQKYFGKEVEDDFPELNKEEFKSLLNSKGGYLRFTPKGRLLSNEVLEALF